MPLGLHPDAQTALRVALADELRAIQVQNNSFLVQSSTAGLTLMNSILPNSASKIGRSIASILGDEPFSDFVFDQLSLRLHDRQFLADSTNVSLTTLHGFEDAEVLAAELVSQFASLPWTYSLFASIPYEIGRRLSAEITDDEYALSDTYRLLRFAEGQAEYPSWPNRNLGLLESRPETRFEHEILYLNYQTSGYVGLYLGLRPVDDLKLTLRALLGLGIAERVFKPRYYYFSGDRQWSAVIFRRDGDKWTPLAPQDLDTRTANLVHSIGPDKLIAKPEEATSKYFASDFLARARSAFADPVGGERILGSAQWLFESHADTNTLLAFVQAMVALEILFGDKASSDVVGLGDLLANRCAYSIAKNRAQRDEILDDFKRIYGTRSRIIHRGQTRLSRKEESDLGTLRWMVSRAIQEELTLSRGK